MQTVISHTTAVKSHVAAAKSSTLSTRDNIVTAIANIETAIALTAVAMSSLIQSVGLDSFKCKLFYNKMSNYLCSLTLNFFYNVLT